MLSTATSLGMLRDVPGVEGSFLLDGSGSIVARDESFALPEAVFASASLRISTLLEAAAEGFEEARELVLAYATHRLFLRVQTPYVLVVLVRANANMEATRMASNIALRQTLRQLAPGPATHPNPLLPSAASPPSARSPLVSTKPQAPAAPAAPPPNAPPPKKKPKNDIWG